MRPRSKLLLAFFVDKHITHLVLGGLNYLIFAGRSSRSSGSCWQCLWVAVAVGGCRRA